MKFCGETLFQSTGSYVAAKPRLFTQLTDFKADGTEGGTFTQDVWQTRTLNTIETDEIGITLASNQITLPAGTYEVFAVAPAYSVGKHKTRLQNTTDASTALLGTSALNNATGAYSTMALVSGQFTTTASKTFELQHYCEATQADSGWGVGGDFAVGERYSTIQIWKID